MPDALVETAEWLAWISEPVSDLTADEIKAWANRQPRRYQLQPVLPREEGCMDTLRAELGNICSIASELRAMIGAAPPSPDRHCSECEDHGCVQGCKRLGYDPAAESSRDDLLRQLEEAKGGVERLKSPIYDERDRQEILRVLRVHKEAREKAEAQRDALLAAGKATIDSCGLVDTPVGEMLAVNMDAIEALRAACEGASHD